MRKRDERTMIVLLDCDGVLADFTGGVLKVVNKRSGTNWKPADVKTFKISENIGISNSLIYEIAGAAGFCMSLKPYPGAKEGVAELKRKHDVYVVTSPITSSPTWVYERTKWLKKHFSIDDDHVINASCKERINGDMLVDDKAENLERWKKQWPAAKAFLWGRPWNELYPAIYLRPPLIYGYITPSPIVRVRTWEQLLPHTLAK